MIYVLMLAKDESNNYINVIPNTGNDKIIPIDLADLAIDQEDEVKMFLNYINGVADEDDTICIYLGNITKDMVDVEIQKMLMNKLNIKFSFTSI